MTLGEFRRRPTLPGRFQPSTISVLRLNFCVRDGNRWIPQAIVTGNMGLSGRFAPLRASLDSFRLRFPCLAPSKPHRSLRFAWPDHGLAPLRFDIPASALALPPLPLLTNHSGSGSGLGSGSAFASAFATASAFPVPFSLFPLLQDQALDRLVSPSSIRYRTSTDDLSTLSSSRGLTHF